MATTETQDTAQAAERRLLISGLAATNTVAELREKAEALGCRPPTRSTKLELAAVLAAAQRMELAKAKRNAEREREATNGGFKDAKEMGLYEHRVRRLQDCLATESAFIEAFATRATSRGFLNQLTWLEGIAEQAAKAELAKATLEVHTQLTAGDYNPAEALEAAFDTCVTTPALRNNWSGTSSSAFHNATDAAYRKAAASLAFWF